MAQRKKTTKTKKTAKRTRSRNAAAHAKTACGKTRRKKAAPRRVSAGAKRDPEESRSYRGRKYDVWSTPSGTVLTVAGKDVDVAIDADSGRCSTSRLPYQEFESVKDLAKALIDEERA